MSKDENVKHKKVKKGIVVSDKMDKSIVVRVGRDIRHPRYQKVVTMYKRYYAHDEKNEARIGDEVTIEETRPLSKSKCWRVVGIKKSALAR
ncbi:MAG: 30S ribosomal protein S17 [Chlamydiales bacterium]|jgi:small subunit ribosomal protein S17|nr:30S ribosomal protein S17 [Chlamydiales bacterium]NCF71353.1 30S ribosomal protein S17 [Chlamydiales bacterium]